MSRGTLPIRLAGLLALTAGLNTLSVGAAVQSGPPSPPSSFTHVSQSTSSIQWNWTASGGATGYELHDSAHTVIATLSQSTLTYTETNLIENARYTRHVHAFNSFGSSGPSGTSFGATLLRTPTLNDFSVTAVSPYQVEVAVASVPNMKQSSIGVQRSLDGAAWTTVSSSGNGPFCVLDAGRDPGTGYHYRFLYGGVAGSTPYSPSRFVTTPPGPPVAPGPITGTAQSTSSIQWSWPNVNAETGYEIHDETHAVRGTVGANVTTFTESGLSANQAAFRHVHAVNAQGLSDSSPVTVRHTKAPDALQSDFTLFALSPTSVEIRANPVPNASSGYPRVDAYVGSSPSGPWSLTATSSQWLAVDSTRAPGTLYWYVIQYVNGDGVGSALSPPKNITTPTGPPPPTGIYLATGQTTSSIQWYWSIVQGAGGFRLHDEAHAEKGASPFGPSVGSTTETGLSENARHIRHVHAFNAVGQSFIDMPFSSWTKVHNPTTSDFSLSVVSGNEIDVRTTPPPNAFAGSTGLYIERSTDNVIWTPVQWYSRPFTLYDSGLLPNTDYYYRILFLGADGSATTISPSQLARTGTTAAAPDGPGWIQGTAQSPTSIQWNWPDGAGETGYQLHDEAHTLRASTGANIDTTLESGLSENTPHVRHVHAVLGGGSSRPSPQGIKYTLAHTPLITDFSLTILAPRRVEVQIIPPPNQAAGLTDCIVERSPDNTNWTVVKDPIYSGTGYLFNDTTVAAGTTNYYRIRYLNGDGVQTDPSPSKVAITSAAPPAVVPTVWSLDPTVNSIRWAWTPSQEHTGYSVEDSAHGVLHTAAASEGDWIETGLAENTAYHRHVHPFNAAGSGPASNVVTAFTAVHTPVLSDFTLTVVSGHQVNIDVVLPPNATNANCLIQRSTDNASWATIKDPWWGQNGYAWGDTLVDGSTLYYYRIAYLNGAGVLTDWSPSKTVTTPPSSPRTPTGFFGTVQGTNSILWQWTDGSEETSYVLHDYAEVVKGSAAADATSHLETPLGENAPVHRHLHAVNGTGASPGTYRLLLYTFLHDPLDTEFTLTPGNSGTDVIVAVTPPPYSKEGLTGVTIEYSTDNQSWSWVTALQSEYTYLHTGLQSLTTYYYRIAYRNGDGAQTAFSPSKSVTTFIPAPTTFTGLAQSTTSIQWSWTNVPGETGYQLHDAVHTPLVTKGADVTTHTESGFQENVQYARHVHALQGALTSFPSPTALTYTKVRDAQTADFTLTALSPSQIQITVTPPVNSTVGQTGCEVERQNGGSWTMVGDTPGVYVYVDSGLAASTTYTYRIRYQNGDGMTSATSNTKNATTMPPPPATPANFRTTAQTANSITWAWDNVTTETGFDVHTDAHTVVGSTGTNGTSWVEPNLNENTSYSRHVHAFSPSGPSGPSNTVAKYTLIHNATVADFTLVVVAGNRIDITVVPPLFNPTLLQTACEIQRSPGNNSYTTIKPLSNVYTFSDTGVTANNNYRYRILYRNAEGVVGPVSAYQAVSTAVPAAPTGLSGTAQSTSSMLWSWSQVIGETGYNLHEAPHVPKATAGANAASVVETSLSENALITRHLHAVNGVGEGAGSSAASKYTLVHDALLADLGVTVVTTTRIDVTVAQPPNPTTVSTGCQIEQSVNGGAWTIVKAFSNTYTYSNTSATPAATYSYRIKYRNADGIANVNPSPVRTVVAVPPPVITTPSKRTKNRNFAVQGTAQSGITVRIYVNGQLEATTTATGGNWSYTAPNKPEGDYPFAARALWGSTESANSNPISVTVDTTPPGPPTNVRTISYSNTVDVYWDPPPDLDIAGYKVFRKTGSGGTWGLLNTTGMVLGTRYRDSTAANGQTYYYRVTAVDNTVAD